MTVPRPRPTFLLRTPLPPDEIMRRLRTAGSGGAAAWHGRFATRHAELFVPPPVQRVWSPWLSVTLEDGEDGGTLVRCRLSPHPQVWTLYAFLSFAVGFGMLVGASWGYAQWVMDLRPWAMLSLPAGALAAAALLAVSALGQRLAREQSDRLRTAIEAALAP